MIEPKVQEYFLNPRKIVKVDAESNYILRLLFDNGEEKFYDMSEKLHGVMAVLKSESKFKEVFVDEFGNVAWDIDKNVDSSIHWNNRIDLCKDALYMDSKKKLS